MTDRIGRAYQASRARRQGFGERHRGGRAQGGCARADAVSDSPMAYLGLDATGMPMRAAQTRS